MPPLTSDGVWPHCPSEGEFDAKRDAVGRKPHFGPLLVERIGKQYAAAKMVYETTDQKSRGRIQRLLYDGDYRDYRVDQWIVRPS